MYNVLLKFCHHVTVEPAMFFYFVSYIILDYANTNLYLQKACRDNITSEVDLSTPCDNEKRGILFVSSVQSGGLYVVTSLLILYLMAASQWSDEAGKRRKVLIVLPMAGQILQVLAMILHTYYWYWSPVAAVLSDVFFQVICGGYVLCLNMCSTYLSDITSIEDRTMRIGILYAMEGLCFPVASALAGWFLHNFGFMNTYLLCLVGTIGSLALGLLMIEDVCVPVENPPSALSALNLLRLKDSFKVLFKKSLGSTKKLVVILLLVLHVAVWFSYRGEKGISYMYFRYRFQWFEKEYGYYLAYKSGGSVVGTLLSLFILSKIFKVHDGLIGTFAGFWDTLAAYAYIFANETWELYFIPLMNIFQGAAISIHYSYISKFYDNSEFGRLTAGLNFFSLFIPICHPLYNMIFQWTIDVFPSAFFILSAFVNFLVFILYGASYYWCKKVGTGFYAVKE